MRIRNTVSFVLLVAFVASGYAQSEPTSVVQSVSSDSIHVPSLASLRLQILASTAKNSTNSLVVPAEHRALFCRFDDKLDQKKIPLRMRLGSLEEVNRMEVKPGYQVARLPQ